MDKLPVVVIGAGPQGLASAAHLRERGLRPLVLERGAGAGAAVAEWGHVRLFSAWPELVDPASVRLLESTGWEAPTTGYPTGQQWVERYLAPLAQALGQHVRFGVEVVGVSRAGRDRLVSSGRADQPFTVHLRDGAGVESRIAARAVIDASGTWGRPGPAGADGLPAIGERSARQISYRIPDHREPGVHAGKHTVVLGSGASAFNALHELTRIAAHSPGTRITWAIRRAVRDDTFGGGGADELPERGALGLRARAAVESGAVGLVTGFRTARVRTMGDQVVLVGEDGAELGPADAVVALTGFRPDLSFLAEVRLDLDPTLEAPRSIAADIDPNLHSCGSVRATGAADLAQPEPDLYLVGMKSYGRAPTFLALTGYEQVRSVAAALAGDHEAAARVELVLPDTGVCGGAGTFDEPEAADGGCCAPATPISISRRTVNLL
ncbi:NAD(P)-binding domain-containing protein [Pseudactinotalea suaedae]|uniref:NAD(P)-binding domain-containing protein n=1 Tax=Pseudactinotalea suaedae TaxID=1524924 RepID=UPI0012E2059B|nr:NAD(P)-binding domain-containing protein [Pseudactinotalea suaedae]